MTGSLKQMNISYDPREDRLLLKVSTSGNSEYRVWLTRRYSELLMKVLGEQMEKLGGPQEVASSPGIREHLKQGAFEQPYEDMTDAAYPLGEEGILGYRINVGDNPAGSLQLQLLPEDGQGLNFNLDRAMLYMLHNLLEQGLGSTGWNLSQPLPVNLH